MQSYSRKTNTHTSRRKRFLTWTGVFVSVCFGIVAFSGTVHASLYSLVSSLIGQQASAQTEASAPVVSSETLSLPTYAASTNPHPVLADSFVPVNGNESLSADMAASEAAQGSEERGNQITSYIVQPDDTLTGIATMFDISVDTIKQTNNLSKSTIQPGQTLKILPVDGLLYTVQKGDSILKIATKFKVTTDDIYLYNELSASSVISVGQQLIVPHGQPSASAVTSYLATQKHKVPSSEPLLDAVWNWPSYSGYWTCPLPGSILTQGLHGHNAVDLAAPRGTPIHAAAAGTVVASKSNGLWNGGYGNFVLVSHANGAETLYAHMSKTVVSIGEHVSKGDVLGYVGMTGMTTGPHVHFEIRSAQNPFVDPTLCQ